MVEMQRIIREVEPPIPSIRLSTQRDIPTIAARREVEPARLRIILRGELDWIAMRCLEKDRKRRYQSVGELSDDIQRYLDDEQVQARPATKIYRLKKFTCGGISRPSSPLRWLCWALALRGWAWQRSIFRARCRTSASGFGIGGGAEAACVGG